MGHKLSACWIIKLYYQMWHIQKKVCTMKLTVNYETCSGEICWWLSGWRSRAPCIARQASRSYPSHSILCVKNWASAVELLHHLCPAVFSALWHFLEKVKCMDVTLPQAGQSRDQMLVGAKFSASIQSSPGAHLVSYTMILGLFPWGKVARA